MRGHHRFMNQVTDSSQVKNATTGVGVNAAPCHVAHVDTPIGRIVLIERDGRLAQLLWDRDAAAIPATEDTPLLREAERHAPDIGVFLTDLDGPANYRPAFPVLWCVPVAHATMPHPFGRKLVLD